jgi:hypothetical protein
MTTIQGEFPVPNKKVYGLSVEGITKISEIDSTLFKHVETCCAKVKYSNFDTIKSDTFKMNRYNYIVTVENDPVSQGYHKLNMYQINLDTNTKRQIKFLVELEY